MARALSIYLPGWPIWLARRKNKSSLCSASGRNRAPHETAAWLLWTSQRSTQLVAYGCERATKAGVRTGMTLAHARSLLAGTAVQEQPYTPEDDATSLRGLARWMLRFAPVVSPDDPDGLMLDIVGCEQLFGGERKHAKRIADALTGWGLHPRMAVAPTFACAWAAARYGHERFTWVAEDQIHEALGPLPIRALRIDPRNEDALADVGIERIEDLLSLPRDELASRFGPALLRRLDSANGTAPETIQPIQPARHFMESHAFEGPIRRLEIIETATRELLARLLRQLHAAERGIRELTVELRRVQVPPETLSLRLTYPNRDQTHLWKLLAPRLERAHLGFGVEEITLRAMRTGRVLNEQAAFLREASRNAGDQPTALGELLDGLIDRLGVEAVTRVQSAETYVPEGAYVHTAVREIASKSPARVTQQASLPTIDPAHRPSQLFDPPESASVMSLIPDGPPIWLNWRGLSGEIIAAVGPERIAFPWWTDHAAPARDYFEIEDEHGRRMWAFRDSGAGNWFVHGQWI